MGAGGLMGGTVYRRFTVVTMVEGRFCGECTVGTVCFNKAFIWIGST